MAMVVSVQADLKNFTTEMDKGMRKVDDFGKTTSKTTDSVQKITTALDKLTGGAIPGLSSISPILSSVKTGVDGVMGGFQQLKNTDFGRALIAQFMGVEKQIIATETAQKALNTTTALYGGLAVAGIGLAVSAVISLANASRDAAEDTKNVVEEFRSLGDILDDIEGKGKSALGSFADPVERAAMRTEKIRQEMKSIEDAEKELAAATRQAWTNLEDARENNTKLSRSGAAAIYKAEQEYKAAQQAESDFATGRAGMETPFLEAIKLSEEAERKARTDRNLAVMDENRKRRESEEKSIRDHQEANAKMIKERDDALMKELRQRAESRKREKEAEQMSFDKLEESLDKRLAKQRRYDESVSQLDKALASGQIGENRYKYLLDELDRQFDEGANTEKKAQAQKQLSNAAIMAGSTEDYQFRFGSNTADRQLKVMQDSLAVERQIEQHLADQTTNTGRSINITVRGN